MAITEADYVIVGAGLTGCALATRLADSGASVLVIEAGKDASDDERTTTAFGGFELTGSELDWAYKTVPQKHTADRVHDEIAGKTVGGGSILNYGGWFRGDSTDYDEWARAVGDQKWNHAGFLPYFRKTENFYDKNADKTLHGFDGPFHVTSISGSDANRKYGLRDHIKDAYTELGVPYQPDPSKGLAGICEFHESWYKGKRQPANLTYGLKNVKVLSETLVQKIILDTKSGAEPIATGVQLVDGQQITARKEVIVCSGSFRSPQVLMLSGIGDKSVLSKHSIPVAVDLPTVGHGLFDHFALFQFYQVKDPSGPNSMGNPHWTDPSYFAGLPVDWAVNEVVPASIMQKAVEHDNANTDDELVKLQNKALLAPNRPHVEEMTLYAPILPGIPVNGSIVATSIMLLLPTSRGDVSIQSADAKDAPLVNPNFYATAADRAALTYGTKRVLQAFLNTKSGQQHIECEVPPPGMQALTAESTDEEIDARIRNVGVNHKHAMGSNPMGKVVDTELRVKGVKGLRVCDASIFPVSIGGHPQATLYALAEKTADMILGRHE